jgi:hypothetical protein
VLEARRPDRQWWRPRAATIANVDKTAAAGTNLANAPKWCNFYHCNLAIDENQKGSNYQASQVETD